MPSGRRLVGLVAFVAFLIATVARGADDPCARRCAGAGLLGNLLDLSLTADALKLLNGHEDPKLKRLLEWRLVAAAAEARRHIDEGATLASDSAIPNLTDGVERATAYVAAHDLDSKPPVPSVKSSVSPSANLLVVRKWLSSQS